MVVGQMRVHDIEAVMVEQSLDCAHRRRERERVLRFGDDWMREIESADLAFELVSADVRIVGILARLAQRAYLGERRRSGTRPAIAGRKMENFHALLGYTSREWRSTLNSSKSSRALSTRKRSSRFRCRRAGAPRYATSSATSFAARSRWWSTAFAA